jgi:hypothetical protein
VCVGTLQLVGLLLLRGTLQLVPASLSAGCAVQPFLWYCLGVGCRVSSSISAALIDLAPLPGGVFSASSPARCASDCGIVSVGLPMLPSNGKP